MIAVVPVADTVHQHYLTDGPWVYFGTTVSGYPTNLYDSLFFNAYQILNANQYEDSITGYYSGTRLRIIAFGKFSASAVASVPDTILTVFNPYTAGNNRLDTFLVTTLNDSLMVWGWYDATPGVTEIKYDSLRKSRKY